MSCKWLYAMRPDGEGCAFSWWRNGLALLVLLGALKMAYGAMKLYLTQGGGPARREAHLQYVGVSQDDGTELVRASPFPSGAWRGYYTQYGASHAVCEFPLSFGPDGAVSGRGADDIGSYSLRGVWSAGSGRVAFTKQYLRGSRTAGGGLSSENNGHAVEYRGTAARLTAQGTASLGGGLRGTWSLRDGRHRDSGDFHLWPVMASWTPPEPEDGGTGTEGGEAECCVCYDAAINVRLEPCGHVALCDGCARRLHPQRCPLCRADIVRRVEVRTRSAR